MAGGALTPPLALLPFRPRTDTVTPPSPSAQKTHFLCMCVIFFLPPANARPSAQRRAEAERASPAGGGRGASVRSAPAVPPRGSSRFPRALLLRAAFAVPRGAERSPGCLPLIFAIPLPRSSTASPVQAPGNGGGTGACPQRSRGCGDPAAVPSATRPHRWLSGGENGAGAAGGTARETTPRGRGSPPRDRPGSCRLRAPVSRCQEQARGGGVALRRISILVFVRLGNPRPGPDPASRYPGRSWEGSPRVSVPSHPRRALPASLSADIL